MEDAMPHLLGIVNMTRDSFSDGGRYLDPSRAVAHALQLVADGADIIDLGAESTNPDAEAVPPATECARLLAALPILKARGLTVSVDTYRPEVMRAVLAAGADFINDVTGFRQPGAVEVAAAATARLIVMHSTASGPRAQRKHVPPETLVAHVVAFFEERIATLTAAGVDRARLILDPGLGFFLGANPQASVAVLRGLDRLRAFGLPLCVSASRKSFIGALLDGTAHPRPIDQRGAGTLAVELWAAQQGVEYIRTHDVRALRDGLRIATALTEP
jgi:dihydropteroate synthase type 2